jgi:hypothetical protein
MVELPAADVTTEAQAQGQGEHYGSDSAANNGGKRPVGAGGGGALADEGDLELTPNEKAAEDEQDAIEERCACCSFADLLATHLCHLPSTCMHGQSSHREGHARHWVAYKKLHHHWHGSAGSLWNVALALHVPARVVCSPAACSPLTCACMQSAGGRGCWRPGA